MSGEKTQKKASRQKILSNQILFIVPEQEKFDFYHFHSKSRQTFSSMKSAQLRTFGLLRRKLCVKRENLLPTRALSVRLFEMV